ncbi:MAG TPA: hypothetical protein VER11_31800 [Polyangiaceae bacterium]|nr:hypothetical protein [Polyangiaceae bacterium]
MTDGASRPDPKLIRPSIVDSGWSDAPPPASEPPPALPPPPTRPLPAYDAPDSGSVREVTLVDREVLQRVVESEVQQRAVQQRARAKREQDTLPPPRRASTFPQSATTAPALRPQGLPPPSVRPAPPSVRPPPPSVRPPPPPPPTAERSVLFPAHAPTVPAPAPSGAPGPLPGASAVAIPAAAPLPAVAPISATATPVGSAHVDAMSVAAARSAATLVRPRPSFGPQPLPSFAGALAQRVRFAGGEVPLWTLVTPLVLLVALGAAFAAAAVTSPADPGAALKVVPEPSASAIVAAAPTPLPPPPVVSAVSASPDEKPKPLTVLERVSQGEDSAIKELSAKPAADLRVDEALALSLGRSAQNVRAARALRERIDHDPGLIKDPEVLAQLRRYSDDPETARDALAAIAAVPGPISADLIYEVWTATSSRSIASDLARSLINSKDVRAKASKPLAVALELRDADTCEKNRDLLPRASSDGDRRSFSLLNKLTRKYGCGPNKRQDCYACLRDGKDLDEALKVVKTRREPRPFGG